MELSFDERDDRNYFEESMFKWECQGMMKTADNFPVNPNSVAGHALQQQQKVLIDRMLLIIRKTVKEREKLLPHLHYPPKMELREWKSVSEFVIDSFEKAFEQFEREGYPNE